MLNWSTLRAPCLALVLFSTSPAVGSQGLLGYQSGTKECLQSFQWMITRMLFGKAPFPWQSFNQIYRATPSIFRSREFGQEESATVPAIPAERGVFLTEQARKMSAEQAEEIQKYLKQPSLAKAPTLIELEEHFGVRRAKEGFGFLKSAQPFLQVRRNVVEGLHLLREYDKIHKTSLCVDTGVAFIKQRKTAQKWMSNEFDYYVAQVTANAAAESKNADAVASFVAHSHDVLDFIPTDPVPILNAVISTKAYQKLPPAKTQNFLGNILRQSISLNGTNPDDESQLHKTFDVLKLCQSITKDAGHREAAARLEAFEHEYYKLENAWLALRDTYGPVGRGEDASDHFESDFRQFHANHVVKVQQMLRESFKLE